MLIAFNIVYYTVVNAGHLSTQLPLDGLAKQVSVYILTQLEKTVHIYCVCDTQLYVK